MTKEQFEDYKKVAKTVTPETMKKMDGETLHGILVCCRLGWTEIHTCSYTMEWLEDQPDWEKLKHQAENELLSRAIIKIQNIK